MNNYFCSLTDFIFFLQPSSFLVIFATQLLQEQFSKWLVVPSIDIIGHNIEYAVRLTCSIKKSRSTEQNWRLKLHKLQDMPKNTGTFASHEADFFFNASAL